MYVTPDARSRGLGRALVDAATAHARALGVESLHLSVTDAHPAAKRLYETAGFVQWGTEPRSLKWKGECVDEHHLAMDLR